MMSSIGKYSEIPRESSTTSTYIPSYSKTIRKMSCFDSASRDGDDSNNGRSKFTKKNFSTNSLPRGICSSNGMNNINGFEVLRVSSEEVANQLTLIDFELFRKIELDELTSCGWIKKNKEQIAPHTVAYTRRFNHVSYWVIEEILSHESPKLRSEAISYFIRVCKRLYELNNLHSLFAIVSALRSASIFRLNSTWSLLSRKDKQAVEKFTEIFSDTNNWSKLREHLDSLKLPCVPYIGVYLTDLVYVSMANPSSSLRENLSANNIFRLVSTYQTESSYSSLSPSPSLQAQLKGVRYIDELLKFVEDDHFKKSIQLEPPTNSLSSSNTNSTTATTLSSKDKTKNKSGSPGKESGESRGGKSASSSPRKFVPGHKKTNSWGNRSKLSEGESSSAESLRHLLDDSLLEKNEEFECSSNTSIVDKFRESFEEESPVVSLEGCLRRKTLLKNGKKPSMAAWQRYWVKVFGHVLLYYPAKSLSGSERGDFKSEPCKMKTVTGCLIEMGDDPLHSDSFHLADPQSGNYYKFRAGSTARALTWIKKLRECQKKNPSRRPTNLIKFD